MCTRRRCRQQRRYKQTEWLIDGVGGACWTFAVRPTVRPEFVTSGAFLMTQLAGAEHNVSVLVCTFGSSLWMYDHRYSRFAPNGCTWRNVEMMPAEKKKKAHWTRHDQADVSRTRTLCSTAQKLSPQSGAWLRHDAPPPFNITKWWIKTKRMIKRNTKPFICQKPAGKHPLD